ncbi:hypothetical protein [Pseudomonas protegens]|uniref:hypothetical protein n=1 Tax=Pseudomonas protegens TaxID=380021 RepID=UPI00276603D3|nr:hypothetical protein [Pseudomonas protegens]MDP9528536.1 hypothetical protein [Pseudomonas protegens]
MNLTGIQIKCMQNTARTYDAIILKFNDMHFSKDLLSGEGGNRDIRRVKKMAESAGIDIDCYEPRLQERIAEALK